MALLFYDGFEGITTAQATLRYVTFAGGASISSAAIPAAPNGQTAAIFGSGDCTISTGATPATAIVGFRFMPRDQGQTISTAINFLRLLDNGGVVHLTFRCQLDGSISVYRGDGTTLLGTTASANLLAPGVWSYLEIKATINDTTGSVEIKQDGTSVLSLTSQDTRNAGNANIARIRFQGHSGTGNSSWFDDVYICDTTGSAPHNDYLGDVRIVMILPSGAGDSTQWTPNAGSNWDRVDETPGHDGDTTYVSDSTAGDTDLYNLAAVPSGAGTVYAAKVIATARKDGAGAQDVELLVKSGTTTDASPLKSLTDSYAEYDYTLVQNPDTSAAWSVADLDAVQVGIRIPV